jgi:Tfp pilus assembly pilus retraction ATPase PilT
MARLDTLFRHLKSTGGSDLHLGAGLPPYTRVHGEMAVVEGWPVFTDESLRAHLRELCDDARRTSISTSRTRSTAAGDFARTTCFRSAARARCFASSPRRSRRSTS